jgi:hypothetical protein
LQDPDQSTGEADFSSKRQAFTMLKHRCAALLIFTMLKHRCAALLIFTMLKLHSSVLFISSHFQKHSSPLFRCSHLSSFFHFSFLPSHFLIIFHYRNNSVQHLFRFFSLLLLKHHYQQLFIFPFSVAETPLPATFHQFSRC